MGGCHPPAHIAVPVDRHHPRKHVTTVLRQNWLFALSCNPLPFKFILNKIASGPENEGVLGPFWPLPASGFSVSCGFLGLCCLSCH